MDEAAFADIVDRLAVPVDEDAYRAVQLIGACFQFLTYRLSFPGVPVRNVGGPFFRVALQPAGLVQRPGSAAGIADKLRALAFHRAFFSALRALVQDAVQPVRAERLAYANALLLLFPEIVELERFLQPCRQFGGGLFLYVLRGKQQAYLCAHLHLALLQAIVQRVAQERAVRPDEQHGYLQFLYQHAHAGGQRRRAAVEGVAGFRIQQHVILQFVQRVRHVDDQAHVRHELVRRDAADAAHQAVFAHEPIGRADDVERMRIQDLRRDLQIDKAGVVHHDEAGLVRDAVQPFQRIGKLGVLQISRARGLHDPAPETGRPHRLSSRRSGQRPDLRQRLFLNFDLHSKPLFA